jgi:hypothetical protein
MRDSPIIRPLLSALFAVVAAGALAGCFETGGQTTAMAPAAAPPPGPQGAPPAAAPPPSAAPRPSMAGRGQTAPPPPPPAAEEQELYTIQKARGECWMSLENNRKAPKELEKRAAIVEKCAQEKMAAQPKT